MPDSDSEPVAEAAADDLSAPEADVAAELPPVVFAVSVVEGSALFGALLWSSSILQFSSPLQVYPKGQQFAPHVGNLLRRAVVLTTAPGFWDAS